MKTVKFEIVGTSPLLMASPKSMQRGSAAPGIKKVPSAEDEAESLAYRDTDGTLFLPSAAFHSALLAACAGRRFGKRGAKSVVSGTVFVTTEKVSLIDPATDRAIRDYDIDVRRCVIQGKSIMRARPRIDKWATVVEFELDTDFMQEPWIEELLGIAGRTVGVGGYRPEKKGPFGRFTAKMVKTEEESPRRKKAA